MSVPPILFDYLDRNTPHVLCMGVALCEPLCLALFTTEALLAAEQEAERELGPDALVRLRAQIVRRHLTAPWSEDSKRRLDVFLARFVPEANPLRRLIRQRTSRRMLPSGVFSPSGQRALHRFLEEAADDAPFLRAALESLVLRVAESDTEAKPIASVPIAFSVRGFVESAFKEGVRPALRRGVCLRLEVEHLAEDDDARLHLDFQGSTPSADVRASADAALRLVQEDDESVSGRIVLRLPEIASLLPIEGASLGLPLYWAISCAARDRECPPGTVLTGALDPATRRVFPVKGLPEKRQAAEEDGADSFVCPADEEQSLAHEPSDAIRTRIVEGDVARKYLRVADRAAAPAHRWLSGTVELVVLAGLVGVAAPFAHLWNLFIVSDSLDPWISTWTRPGLSHDLAIYALGLPLGILFAIEPLLIFAWVFGEVLPQAQGFVNWKLRGRWERGFNPSGIGDEDEVRRTRTAKQRIGRTVFKLGHGWAFYALAVLVIVSLVHLNRTILGAMGATHPKLNGLVTLTLVAAGFGAVMLVATSFRKSRARLTKMFPSLR